jgi:hypothetical protein
MIRAAFLSIMGIAASASAIVIQDYTTAEAAPSGLDWSYVYNYKGSSAVAVGANWLLTAAHVADDGGTGSIPADGTVFNQLEIIFHPSADLALVRYDKSFPGSYSLYTGGLLFDPKLTVILVGYGSIGSAFDFGWTDNGSGKGTKRWGTQEISNTALDGFWMSFGLNDTTYEAGTGVGDSGGGVFYDDGGIWKLAGINTKRVQIDGQYKSTFAVGMSDYADWVATTIPEAGTIHMLGLGTFGLFLMRSRTRRKADCSCSLPPRKVYARDPFAIEPERQRFHYRIHGLLIELGYRAKELVQPVEERLSFRYKKYDRLFWNYMIAVHERRAVRKKAVKVAFKRKALGWFDTCLEHIMK